jgi:Domain of unknown function (DUF4266)
VAGQALTTILIDMSGIQRCRLRPASFPNPAYLALLLLGVVALAASGCQRVRFNQKQRLAEPAMRFDRDHLGADLEGHILAPREGAIGGFSSVGAGGCGCN